MHSQTKSLRYEGLVIVLFAFAIRTPGFAIVVPASFSGVVFVVLSSSCGPREGPCPQGSDLDATDSRPPRRCHLGTSPTIEPILPKEHPSLGMSADDPK